MLFIQDRASLCSQVGSELVTMSAFQSIKAYMRSNDMPSYVMGVEERKMEGSNASKEAKSIDLQQNVEDR